jgi:hypothetical protein
VAALSTPEAAADGTAAATDATSTAAATDAESSSQAAEAADVGGAAAGEAVTAGYGQPGGAGFGLAN